MANLKFKPQGLRKARKAGLVGPSDNDLATAFGVDRTTVYRVTTGQSAPGTRFVAGVMRHLGPEWVGHMFDAVDDRRCSR